MKRIYFITLLLFLINIFVQPQIFSRKLKEQKINIDGIERSFYLHVPKELLKRKKVPLLVVLHGGGRDGRKVARQLGFMKLADKHKFVTVFPNGINGHWNDGRGVTYRGKNDPKVNDVKFISILIDQLIKNKNIDEKRIYVTGLSNGGMMTLRLGCKLSEKLTAIAPVIANIPLNIYSNCKPKSPLPILIMNGTKDPLVPWKGGYVKFLRKKMGKVVSTEETVNYWIENNKCDKKPTVKKLPDKVTDDNSTVTVSTYPAGMNGSVVVLYSIVGGGHTLPGSKLHDMPRFVGNKNMDINGADVIWQFLSGFSK